MHEIVISAVPLGVHQHEGAHESRQLFLLDGNFERFQIQLASGLFTHNHIAAVGAPCLQLVEGEVFCVGINALLKSTMSNGGGHHAGDQRILGEVFSVPASERGAMQVHPWGIPAIVAKGIAFLAYSPAIFLKQRHIPGCCHDGFRGKTGGFLCNVHGCFEKIGEASGTVIVGGGLFFNRCYRNGTIAAAANELLQFIQTHLTDEHFPARVVIVHFVHDSQLPITDFCQCLSVYVGGVQIRQCVFLFLFQGRIRKLCYVLQMVWIEGGVRVAAVVCLQCLIQWGISGQGDRTVDDPTTGVGFS